MKRALLPIALFALLTYCLPLVSLFVPALASGDEAGASSVPESAQTNQSPAAQFLAPEAEQEPGATGSADSEVISPLRTFWVSISVMLPREPET